MKTKITKTAPKTTTTKRTTKGAQAKAKIYERVLKAVAAGKPQGETCRKFGVLPNSFAVWKSKFFQSHPLKHSLVFTKTPSKLTPAGEARKAAREALKADRTRLNTMYKTPKAAANDLKRSAR